jgi:Holliday junction DNA helicase RuvB
MTAPPTGKVRVRNCAHRLTPLAESGPSALDEIVGQRETKRLLNTAVLAANRRGAALDHALFFGPPGVGKSTVARLLAIDLGVRAKVVNAPTLSEPGVLLRLLTGLRARDVLFIDEIHALPQRLVETLYEAMEERRASFAVGDGRRSRTLSVKLEPFTLVGATTEAGRLPAPFESRFGLQAFFAPYELDDLREILLRAATREGLRLEDGAAATLAAAARGSARTALALFRRARDCAQLRAPGDESPRLDQGAAEAALAALTIDARGLKAVERRALDALVVRGAGQTVGLARWSALAGIDAATLRRSCEPALLDAGLIRIGPRGRTPTAAAYSGDAGAPVATRGA